MSNLLINVCDSQDEANFASALWKAKGYTTVTTSQVQMIQLLEVDGNPGNYALAGKYARAGTLWIVTASN